MVPEGWWKCRLGEILTFKNGLNTDKSNYGHGVKFVNVMDVFKNDCLFFENIIGSVSVTDKQLAEYSVRYGDILFNRTSETYDEIAMSSTYLDNEMITFGGFVIRGRPVAGNLHPLYSVFCFQARSIRKEFVRRGQGAVRANIGQKDLSQVSITLPPLPEQKKIAQILSTWDQAIATTEQLLANSQQQKKALMQQLLTGKKRFPGFGGEWKDYSLTNIADVIVSPVDKKTVDSEIPVELCNYTDVYYNTNITRKLNFMKATAKQSEIDKFTLKAGDVIITKDSETPGDIAVPALVIEDLGGVVCGYHLAIIRPHEKLANGAFLNYLFASPKTSYYFFTLATGATRFGLSVGGINKAHLKLPPVKEQKKIASVLSTTDQEIETLKQKLNHLKQEKKALMQQLLTGKRRVKLEHEAAA